jgi:hypothetical protein
MTTKAKRSELSRRDRELAEMLAGRLARLGETTTPREWDDVQDGDGWMWDSGWAATRSTGSGSTATTPRTGPPSRRWLPGW